MNKRANLIFIVIMLVVFSTSCVFAYSDVPNTHWAYEAVTKMSDRGIINGYPDGTFKPEKLVTRAEFAKLLVNTLEITDSSNVVNFEDIERDHWAKEYIDLANPFLTGYISNGKYYFKPNEYALREDAAVALVKAKRITKGNIDTINRFSDKEDISENVAKYVAIAVENGLVAGYPNGTFKPKKGLTRAEIATLFSRIYESETEYEEEEKIVVDDLEKEEVDNNDKQDILFGDLNGDGSINIDDAEIIAKYNKGKYELSKIQKELADTFADGKIDKMDELVIENYIDGDSKELPHTCGKYEIVNNNKKSSDSKKHAIILICNCKKIRVAVTGTHSFTNGVCICGATENEPEDAITWNGDYISNINGLTKVKLTKLSDTKVNFYIKCINNTGFHGANSDAEILGNMAKYTYELFEDKGEIIFKFEGKDLIIETSGYEELSILDGTYKLDDGSVSEIKWTIQKNPIEGEYILGEEIEAPNMESYEEFVDFLQTAPTSVTLTISDMNKTSSAFSIGGFVNGSMIACMGSLEKVGDKWKYFDESEGKYVLEISFEDGKAIITDLNEKLNGIYIKKALVNEYEKYEKALEESSVGEGVFIF
ncbi:MAG: S-layer homology domain-containing protein [Clostridia bacterium]|nr:S-layer homology domain-containing protein [Clostridia bacterium]